MLVGSLDGTLDDCPIDGLKKVSIEEYTEYVNLSDEEKLKYNGEEINKIASNASYMISLS